MGAEVGGPGQEGRPGKASVPTHLHAQVVPELTSGVWVALDDQWFSNLTRVFIKMHPQRV